VRREYDGKWCAEGLYRGSAWQALKSPGWVVGRRVVQWIGERRTEPMYLDQTAHGRAMEWKSDEETLSSSPIMSSWWTKPTVTGYVSPNFLFLCASSAIILTRT